jgi:hypothetical protein
MIIKDKYRVTSKKEDIIMPTYFFVKALVIGFKGKMKLYHT